MDEITPIRGIGPTPATEPGTAQAGAARPLPGFTPPRPPPERQSEPPAAEIETTSPAIRRVRLQYQVELTTRKVTVLIMDADTGEILRTIPPEELARELARLRLQGHQR